MDVQLIEIKQDNPGLNGFLGSWLCRNGVTFVVDVGPARSGRRLVKELEKQGCHDLNYVLLSHIHIDHAGALADVLERYPAAQVISHNKGLENLESPSKLWQASRSVLQGIAEGYGPPRPVSRERLIPHTENPIPGLEIIETPGHAPHHLSFRFGGRLFAGEAAGNYFVIRDKEYLRPATPPRFFLDVFLKSVDRLLALQDQPIHYAHFGQGDSSHRLLARFRKQLLAWHDIIREQFSLGGEDIIGRCVEILLERDANLEVFSEMDEGAQARERFFMANAVRGFVGYFQERAGVR